MPNFFAGLTSASQITAGQVYFKTLVPTSYWCRTNLHVIPFDMISCILQHEETILMLSWSTISTRHSPSFLADWITSPMTSANKYSVGIQFYQYATDKTNHSVTFDGLDWLMFKATFNILGHIVAVSFIDVLPNMHTCKHICSGWKHVIISTVL